MTTEIGKAYLRALQKRGWVIVDGKRPDGTPETVASWTHPARGLGGVSFTLTKAEDGTLVADDKHAGMLTMTEWELRVFCLEGMLLRFMEERRGPRLVVPTGLA